MRHDDCDVKALASRERGCILQGSEMKYGLREVACRLGGESRLKYGLRYSSVLSWTDNQDEVLVHPNS